MSFPEDVNARKSKDIVTSAVSRRTPRAALWPHAFVLLLATWAGHASQIVPVAHAQERPIGVALDVRSEQGNAASLPLVGESARVRIDDGHATTTVEHAFQNESKARLEGTYKLVVGEGATAIGFSYWNGSDRIVGEVFEREAAQQVYEQISGLSRDPGLLEQTGEGAFSFRVFPIEPGEKKRIEVTTARWLPRRNGQLEYRARIGRSDAAMDIELRDARGVDAVESPSHELTLEALPDGVRVRAGKAKKDDGEFVLTYAPKTPGRSMTATMHKGEEHAFVALSVSTPPPPSHEKRPAHDVTLVLDRSGSMSGSAMEGAKAAAARVVERLRDDDAVNVIAFDDNVDVLFAAPQVLDSRHRGEVLQFLSKIQPRGGTDIARALGKALSLQSKDARRDVVFFLTDGQSDGPAAIRAATEDASDTTVFTVGLGEGVDKALLSRIASIKHGRFTFVADARAVPAELPKLLAQLSTPVWTDLRLSAEGGALDMVYPATLPDVFQDDELRIFARTTAQVPSKLVLEAKENGAARKFEVAIDASKPARPWIARSWALGRVDDLLGIERQHGSDKESVARHDEIVDLGLTYNLVTPHTSFLAIPERELTASAANVVGSMRERRRKLLAANRDAAALSRMNMPPGDPVITVRAPKDAQRVTAHFPFGLVQDLSWDESKETWTTRFLVPKSTPDGTYDVMVTIVRKDGQVELATTHYTIDADEPDFEVDVTPMTGGAWVYVRVDEEAREVRVAKVGVISSSVKLAWVDTKKAFAGFVPLEAGEHALRVVVADRARNESEQVVQAVVKP